MNNENKDGIEHFSTCGLVVETAAYNESESLLCLYIFVNEKEQRRQL